VVKYIFSLKNQGFLCSKCNCEYCSNSPRKWEPWVLICAARIGSATYPVTFNEKGTSSPWSNKLYLRVFLAPSSVLLLTYSTFPSLFFVFDCVSHGSRPTRKRSWRSFVLPYRL